MHFAFVFITWFHGLVVCSIVSNSKTFYVFCWFLSRSFKKVSAELKSIRHVSSVVEWESSSDAGCIWQKLQGKEMTEKNKNTSKYSLRHYILIANLIHNVGLK